MKWVLLLVAGFALLVFVVALIGWTLPQNHRASRTALIHASPDAVFGIVADVARTPAWKSGVTAVDMLPDDAQGRRRFREHANRGAVTYRVDVAERPSRFVTRIDEKLPYGGSWTYELRPAPDGTTALTIMEDGEVYNPIFRVMQRVFFSPYASMDRYLIDLDGQVLRTATTAGRNTASPIRQ